LVTGDRPLSNGVAHVNPQNAAAAYSASSHASSTRAMKGPRPALTAQAAPFHPYNITFGSWAESEESSPTIPPSATSTLYTQPTPMSDMPSHGSHYDHDGGPQGLPRFGFGMPFQAGLPILPPFVDNPNPRHRAQQSFDTDMQSVRFGPPLPIHSLPLPPPKRDYTTAFLSETKHFGEVGNSRLMGHVLRQFAEEAGSDCVLHITTTEGQDSIPAHSIIVSRSSFVEKLLATSTKRDDKGRVELNIKIEDPLITCKHIRHALRTCYGGIPFSTLTLGDIHSENEPSMTRILGLLASAQFFELESLSELTTRLASISLDVSNLESVFAFCLEGFEPYQATSSTLASPKLEYLDPVITKAHAPHSTHILGEAIHYTIAQLFSHFHLDTQAPASALLGGLPARNASVSFSKPSAGNTYQHTNASSFSSIRFGSFPSFSSESHTVLSSILLSVPFPIVERILMHVPIELGGLVVAEREKRRLGRTRTLKMERARGGMSMEKKRGQGEKKKRDQSDDLRLSYREKVVVMDDGRGFVIVAEEDKGWNEKCQLLSLVTPTPKNEY